MNMKKIILSATTILTLLSSAAYAGPHDRNDRGRGYDKHRGHDRHHNRHHDRRDHHKSRTSISLNFGAPAYYRYRPYPPAPYYTSTQYIYTQPVVVTQPTQTLFDERYCREYQTTQIIGGRPVPGYGTACYQPDGSWQIVSN